MGLDILLHSFEDYFFSFAAWETLSKFSVLIVHISAAFCGSATVGTPIGCEENT